MKKILKEKYQVEANNLMVVYLGGFDILLGEVDSDIPFEDLQNAVSIRNSFIPLRNPKRIARLTLQSPQGIQINLTINDFDLMGSTGSIEVKPLGSYFVERQTEETKTNIYTLLISFYEQKILDRAKEVGIVAPNSPLQRR